VNVNKETLDRIRKTPRDKLIFDFSDDACIRVYDTVGYEEWAQVFPELVEERHGCDIIIIYKWATSVVYMKNGSRPYYKSDCPFYSGYWLLGGCGNVACKSSVSPVPGRVNSLYCTKDYTACPLYKIEKEVNDG